MKKDKMSEAVREYLRAIGSKGGKKSRRKLTKKQARDLNKIRWEKWRKEHEKP